MSARGPAVVADSAGLPHLHSGESSRTLDGQALEVAVPPTSETDVQEDSPLPPSVERDLDGVIVPYDEDNLSDPALIARRARMRQLHSVVMLCEAAARGDRDTLRQIVTLKSCNINSVQTTTGRCALHEAAANGHAALLRILLRNGARVDMRTGLARSTALHVAAACGQADCVHSLLDAGAGVDCHDRFGNTPLHVCSTVPCATHLLDFGASTFAKNRRGQTPFVTASKSGFQAVAMHLRMREVEDYAGHEAEKRDRLLAAKRLEREYRQQREIEAQRRRIAKASEDYRAWRASDAAFEAVRPAVDAHVQAARK